MSRKFLALQADATIERTLARRVAEVAPQLPADVQRAAVDAAAYQLAHDYLPTVHDTERTERPAPRGRSMMVRNGGTTGREYVTAPTGHVTSAERRTMLHRCSCDGACACVQSYPALDGAPVGSVPSLQAARAEASAAWWDARHASTYVSPAAKRRARRAAKGAP